MFFSDTVAGHDICVWLVECTGAVIRSTCNHGITPMMESCGGWPPPSCHVALRRRSGRRHRPRQAVRDTAVSSVAAARKHPHIVKWLLIETVDNPKVCDACDVCDCVCVCVCVCVWLCVCGYVCVCPVFDFSVRQLGVGPGGSSWLQLLAMTYVCGRWSARVL